MIVMKADNKPILILAITEAEVELVRSQRTLEYYGHTLLAVQDIIVMYGKDKQEVLNTMKLAGITISSAVRRDYLADVRTDRERTQ